MQFIVIRRSLEFGCRQRLSFHMQHRVSLNSFLGFVVAFTAALYRTLFSVWSFGGSFDVPPPPPICCLLLPSGEIRLVLPHHETQCQLFSPISLAFLLIPNRVSALPRGALLFFQSVFSFIFLVDCPSASVTNVLSTSICPPHRSNWSTFLIVHPPHSWVRILYFSHSFLHATLYVIVHVPYYSSSLHLHNMEVWQAHFIV